MRGRIIGLARGRPCDQGIDLDELRLVRSGLASLGDGVGQTLDVLLVGAVRLDEAELVGVPAVGLEALEHVLSQNQIGVAFDLDAVGIEDDGQVAQLLVGSEEAASPEIPSSISPSPQMTQMLWSNGDSPAGAFGSSRPRWKRWP